jgi:HSP20 family molecular chaperone IbpA
MVDETSLTEGGKKRASGSWGTQRFVAQPPQFVPPVDVIELDDTILILLEIAGIQTDELKITLYHRLLVIRGNRPRTDFQSAMYHQAEVRFGAFSVEIPIPWAIQEQQVLATYQSGFLKIELTRKQAQRIHIVDLHNDQDEGTIRNE